MTIRFADQLSRLGTESAFEVLAHARLLEAEGRNIVHLEIGEPDFATPDNIIDAAVHAMHEGATHYTAASGIREVREKTAAYVTRHTGVPTQFENIVLTPGSKNLLLFALLALIEEGDEVIVPDPGYPIYRSLVEFIGGRAISLPLRQEHEFRADVDKLRQADHAANTNARRQLPTEPDRRDPHPQRLRGDRPSRHRARPDRPQR